MATRVIYGDKSDNCLMSTSTDYETARAMTSPTLGNVTGTPFFIDSTYLGQRFTSPNYTVLQAFIAFDTRLSSDVSSVTLQLHVSLDLTQTEFITEVRTHDWGTTVDTGDAVAGADLGSKTLVAELNSFGSVSGNLNTFTDIALSSSINTNGYSRYILASSRQRLGNAPGTNSEHVGYGSGDSEGTQPRITITDTTTQSSQTLPAGTTSFTPTQISLHEFDLWGAGGRPPLLSVQEAGGGGAAYSFTQISLTSLSSITIQVAGTNTTGGSAGNSSWIYSASDPNPLALGGETQFAGSGINSRGTITWPGGSGADAQGGGGSRGGSGAGSSAGTAGSGNFGTIGSGAAGGAGGIAPAGGGDGGTGGNNGLNGQDGFVPGGGAGGGGRGAGDAGNGAAGKMVVYWYVPSGPPPRRRVVLFG